MGLISEERFSDSPFVQSVWHSYSERPDEFISTAGIYWEMVLMHYQGKTSLAVRGPETRATQAAFPGNAEWLGITFKLGTFMPCLPPGTLLNRRDANLPEAGGQSFWLHGSVWEFPTYENADTFVRRLECEGLLEREPVVEAVLQCRAPALSIRSIQYRFRHATGLTQSTVRQIERARCAAELLAGGMTILDTTHELGYFDQSHLTNELKRYVGQTPSQIVQAKPAR